VTYTLTLTIAGNPVSGIVLQDTLPLGMTFLSFLNSSSQTLTAQIGSILTWTLPTLSPGTYTYQYQVKIDDLLPGGTVMTNSVLLTAPSLPNETALAPVTEAYPDTFYVSKNIFNAEQESVSIFVAIPRDHAKYTLRVYNSAGEHIKTLDDQYLTAPFQGSYNWDGTNKYGQKCASGMYILYCIEPYSRKMARVLLIR